MFSWLWNYLDGKYNEKWNYPCPSGGEHEWQFQDGSYLGCYSLPDTTICLKCGDEVW